MLKLNISCMSFRCLVVIRLSGGFEGSGSDMASMYPLPFRAVFNVACNFITAVSGLSSLV